MPGKPCLTGSPFSQIPTPFTERDKVAYLKRATALAAPPHTDDPAHVVGWPKQIPPFVDAGGPDDGVAWAEPHGSVVIARATTADEARPAYDVIDRAGRRIAVITVEPNERIVGFGAKAVYTTATDSDALQHLQRHAWR